MPSNLRTAIRLTLMISLLLTVAVLLMGRGPGWPEPENPPRQGEALDVEPYRHGQYVHSQASLARWVREPFNTWTNLAFVLCGALLFSSSGAAAGRQTGLALIAVGVGSFLYHASASRVLRHWDVGAMYWLYLMLIVLALGIFSERFRSFFERTATAWMLALPALAAWITLNRNVRLNGWKPLDLSLFTAVAATLTVFALLLALRKIGGTRWTLGAIAVFGLAVTCQIGDRPGGWLCNPGGVVQAHGLWHILAAIACWMTCIQLTRAWGPTSRPLGANIEIVHAAVLQSR